MKSLIKWPGGKDREFAKIKALIPDFNRYIEPFFGGGAVFFNLNTSAKKAQVNDLSTDLICFYQLVQRKDVAFKEYLYNLVNCWESIGRWLEPLMEDLVAIYLRYREGYLTDQGLEEQISYLLSPGINLWFSSSLTLDNGQLRVSLLASLRDKLKRMKELELKKGHLLPLKDIKDNINSGIRGGFYLHFRNIYNDINLKRLERDKLPLAYRMMVFYFLREYCYGSMFRYNNRGEFNIPFGGISYCKKDFRKKVEYVFSPEIQAKLQGVEFSNHDFEDFWHSLKLTQNDFIFLDPPYDSDFSDYESRSFGKEDQTRLARLLYQTKGKFILLIKNTPFIKNLYTDKPGITIYSFDKVYTYNVRGRNQRDVEHLIITNI